MARCEVRSAGRVSALAGVWVVLTSILGPPALSAREVDLDSRVRVVFGGVRYHDAEQVFVTSGTLTTVSSDVLLGPPSDQRREGADPESPVQVPEHRVGAMGGHA
jgi:hypothetical protein